MEEAKNPTAKKAESKAATKPKTTTRKNSAAKKRTLKSIYSQEPTALCDFVNTNKVDVVTITAFDRFQALYYYAK